MTEGAECKELIKIKNLIIHEKDSIISTHGVINDNNEKVISKYEEIQNKILENNRGLESAYKSKSLQLEEINLHLNKEIRKKKIWRNTAIIIIGCTTLGSSINYLIKR